MPTSHPLQSEHPDHNVPPRFHDAYYHGVNDPYHSSLPAPTFYPFYPPHPPLARAGPIPHPEGNANPSPGTQRPQIDSGSDRDMHVKDAT